MENPRLAEIDGGQQNDGMSIFAHIEQGLRRNPHGRAVICMHQRATRLLNILPIEDEGLQQHDSVTDANLSGTNGQDSHDGQSAFLELTYAQLHGAALKLAAKMLAIGVQQNTTTLMLIPNGGEYAVLLWTCTIMRLTAVSLDPFLLEEARSTDLQDVLKSVIPSLVVVPNNTGLQAIKTAIEASYLPQPFLISLSEGVLVGSRSLSSLDATDLLVAARYDDPNRTHTILFTSGTSGAAKGCEISVANITHVLNSQAWLLPPNVARRALQQAHNSRAIAPAQILQTWRAGGCVVMTGRGLEVDDIPIAIQRCGVSFVVLTPTMVHSVADVLTAAKVKGNGVDVGVGSVQRVQVGGDAVTRDVLEKCEALFPQAEVCVNHGMTEGAGSFFWPFFGVSAKNIPFFAGEISPIGKVAPGSRVRIWDADKDSAAKRGELGELHICGGSLIDHYMDGLSPQSFYEDGHGNWFKTGDVAIIDDEGLVFILGRIKDMIKRAGVSIMPAVIESLLEKFIGRQTIVLSIPHPGFGHELYAVVSDLSGRTESEIKELIHGVLGNDYELGGVVSLEQLGLETYPVNPTHKIIKSEVQTAVMRYIT